MKHKGGSGLCRKALWLWCLTIIEPKRNKGGTPIVRQLREQYNQAAADFARKDISRVVNPGEAEKRGKGIRIKLARAYLRRKVSIALFHELVRELGQKD